MDSNYLLFYFDSDWFNVLSHVHSATEQQLREMQDEQANPKNAVVSNN